MAVRNEEVRPRTMNQTTMELKAIRDRYHLNFQRAVTHRLRRLDQAGTRAAVVGAQVARGRGGRGRRCSRRRELL